MFATFVINMNFLLLTILIALQHFIEAILNEFDDDKHSLMQLIYDLNRDLHP